jgi:hypothetical protein
MAYSRFRITEGVNEFQTVDFQGGLPLSVRRDGFSGKLTFYHESAHLGDDYIRRTNDRGFRYSREGFKGLLSLESRSGSARAYGGGFYLVHVVPTVGRSGIQAGAEFQGCPRRLLARLFRFYLAQDLQYHADVAWAANSRTEGGLRIAFKDSPRAMRFHVGYFTGHSAFGQFFLRRENWWDLGLDFEL